MSYTILPEMIPEFDVFENDPAEFCAHFAGYDDDGNIMVDCPLGDNGFPDCYDEYADPSLFYRPSQEGAAG